MVHQRSLNKFLLKSLGTQHPTIPILIYFTILKNYFIIVPYYFTILPILQYLQVSQTFIFSILLIKIIYLNHKLIFLRNKIIYPPITVISFFLILSVQEPQILQKTPSPHAHHCCTTHTWNNHNHHHHQHQHKKKKKPRPLNTTHHNPTLIT